MAKQIKAIKCPSCGSTQATELRADYYRCSSCSTEYFLDSDDININHNHHYRYPTPDTESGLPYKALPYIGIGAGVVLVFIIVLFSIPSVNTPSVGHVSESSTSKDSYKWSDYSLFPVLANEGKPLYIIAGYVENRAYTPDEDKAVYVGLYDPLTQRQLKMDKLVETAERLSSTDVRFRVFDDNQLYLVYKKAKVFRFDKQALTFREITPEYVKTTPELNAGIATIEFQYVDNGSGFKVVTNEGKQVVFYPLINQVYPEKKISAAYSEPIADAVVKTGFLFSETHHDFPDEKIQLINYQYRHKDGYPKDDPSFRWHKDYGGAGIFTNRSPFTKRFISQWGRNRSRLVDYADFTPDRTYFDAKVLAYTDSVVVIVFKATPAPDERETIQALNVADASIKWSVQPEVTFLDQVLVADSGYVLAASREALYVDAAGQAKNQFKVSEINVELKK